MLRFVGALVLFAVIVTGFYAYTFDSSLDLLGFNPQGSTTGEAPFPLADTLIGGAALLVGILFGSVYDSVRGAQGQVHLGREIANAIRSPHFVKALLAAPIVFCGVYLASKNQPDRVVAALFAFENGFFCDAVLREKRA